MKTLMMLLAIGTIVSGHWPKEACAERDERDNGVEKVTAKGDTEKNEERKAKKAKGTGKGLGPVAGPSGVDSRITLTPVTDGSCDWEYKPVLLNLDIAGPSESACIVQIPDWVPADKREDPTAKYYFYHSNHGGGSILMNWAKSMEDLIAGNLPKVKPITIDSSTLVPPGGKKTVGNWARTPMTMELEGAIHLKPLHIGHISAPDIYIDEENKRFVMLFHGFDKGQFYDLPTEEIEAAGGENGIGTHMEFAATSPYARNFNAARVNGIECGGHEGYGPIMSVDGFCSDKRKRMVVMGHRYGEFFQQHGRFYTLARGGLISRAPLTNPFEPAANGHTSADTYWPWEKDERGPSYNRLSAVQDWIKGGSGVVMAEHLKFHNHPKNPNPGTRPTGDVGNISMNRINDTHFEIFVTVKSSDFPDVYRVVLDATSADWRDWHLEHDENGVIFDVAVDHKVLLDEYNAKHGTSIAIRGIGATSVFIDNKGTPNKNIYLTFASKTGTKDKKDGKHNLGILRLDKK